MPSSYTWNGDAWTDSTGKPVDPSVIASKTYPVRTPAEVGSGIGSFIKRNAGPLAAQTGGEMLGTAAGAALAPETGGMSMMLPLIMGAVGAGAGNVAASKVLPPKYGGTPDASTASEFALGALPSMLGRGVPKAIGAGIASRGAKASTEAAEEFEKATAAASKETHGALAEGIAGPPQTQANVRNVGHLLGSLSGQASDTPIAEARTQAKNTAIDAVMGPIGREMDRLGSPIGDAYKKIKSEGPVSEQTAADIASAAQDVRDDLISPAHSAAGTFAKIKRFVPQNVDPNAEPLGALQQRALGTNQAVALSNVELARLQGEGADLPKEIPGKPPSPNELRDLRQVVNQKLRTANGGDRYALRHLQMVLDKHLDPYLPADIADKRAAYQGFIVNYEKLNPLRRAGTPEQVSDWLFTRDKSVQREIIQNATPTEKDTYQQLFAQRVLSKVDVNLPAKAQSDAIRGALQPYIQNGSVRALYGDAANRQIVSQIYAPLRRAEVAESLKSPVGQRNYGDSFAAKAKATGKVGREAAEAGYQAFYDALPPEQQQILRQVAQPIGPAEPVRLPSTQESLATGLKPNNHSMYIPRFAVASALGTVGAAIGGASAGTGGSYMTRVAIGFGVMAAGSEGYRALMNAGGADLLAKMYSSPGTRAAGTAAFNALVKLGTRKLKEQSDAQQ